MRNRRNLIVTLVVVGLVVVGGIVALVWALDRDTTKTEAGTCDGASYRLEVEEDDGMLEGSFELTTTSPGETWQVRVEHDGTVLHESEQPSDDEAEIDVDVRLPADATGDLTATATDADGRTCTTTVSLG